jgi:hypothetical protein
VLLAFLQNTWLSSRAKERPFLKLRIDAPVREDRPLADDRGDMPFTITLPVLITNREDEAAVSLDLALLVYKGDELLGLAKPVDSSTYLIDVGPMQTSPRISLEFELNRYIADEVLADADVLCDDCGWKHIPDDAFRLRVVDRLSDTEREFVVPGSYPPGARGQARGSEVRIGDTAGIRGSGRTLTETDERPSTRVWEALSWLRTVFH